MSVLIYTISVIALIRAPRKEVENVQKEKDHKG